MPTKPKHPCAYPGCPELTNKRYCDKHQKMVNQQYERYGRDPIERLRYQRSWKKIRNTYIHTHPLCEECLRQGKTTFATEVHHIVPLGHGGTNDWDNLMSLCKPCHSRITAQMGDRWPTKKL